MAFLGLRYTWEQVYIISWPMRKRLGHSSMPPLVPCCVARLVQSEMNEPLVLGQLVLVGPNSYSVAQR